MKLAGVRISRAVPSGVCKWLTSVGMLTVLAGPVIIHTVWQREPRFAEIVTVKRQIGPFLAQFDLDGSTTTMAAARIIHDGDRLAWILRMCSSAAGVVGVEARLVATDIQASGPPVSWEQQSVSYRSGECRNIVLRATIPIGAPSGRYELRSGLRMVLKSGRVVVGELAPVALIVAGASLD